MICRIMVEVKAVIKNDAGIHCRPTAVITQAAAAYKSKVTVTAPSGLCELGSALELMILGLEYGTQITIQAKGPDEAAAAAKFKELFETEFDFPNAGQG
jgi:phosphocarrier protein HPr